MPLRAYILLCLLALMAACTDPKVDRTLADAEALMELRPDSALTLLQTLDGASLRGERRARHALLLSQAFDKNNIDITSDSLISIATAYYSDSDDLRHKMLAHYYTAVVHYNNQDNALAVQNALKAYDIATEINDLSYLSCIETILGLSFYTARSFQTAYEWELKALEHAKIANRQEWLSGLYMRVGDDLHLLQRFQESLEYLDSAEVLATGPDINILETKYLSQCFLGNITEADSIYNHIVELGFQPSMRIAIAQAEIQPRNALTLLNRYDIENEMAAEAYSADMAYALAYLRKGDIDSAIEALYRYTANYNKMIAAVYGNTLNGVQHQHDLTVADDNARKAKSYRTYSITIIIVLALVIIIAGLVIFYLQNKQKTIRLRAERNLFVLDSEYKTIKLRLNYSEEKISEKQDQIDSLENEIFTLRLYNDSDQQLINHQNSTIDKLNAELVNLRKASYRCFLNQFSWIEKVYSLYIIANKNPKCREPKLTELISREITSTVKNNSYINLLSNLIEQYDSDLPRKMDNLNLKKSEREILICAICGLSADVTALLLKKSTRTIYNLKSQIKSKLRLINSPESTEIIELIN